MEEYLMKVMMCGSECVESFCSHRTYSQLKQLPLVSFYSCAASSTGPIALLYRKFDPKKIPVSEPYDSHILIFNCRGELLRTVPFDLKERIILFQFTLQQNLLIVYATGIYFILDTATGSEPQQGNYLSDGDSKTRCLGAQLVGDKVVMLREKTLGRVEQLKGEWKPFPNIKLSSQFPVFESSSNAPEELEIVYLNSTYEIQLYTVKGKDRVGEILYSHPEIRNLAPLLIALSYSNGFLILVFTQFVLWINCTLEKEKRITQVILPPKPSSSTIQKNPNNNAKEGIGLGKFVVGGGISEKGIEAIRGVFGEKIIPFLKFRIEKEDTISKSQSTKKYRNFYTIGWMENVCYFNDKRRLFLTTIDSPNVIQIPASQSAYLLAAGKNLLRIIDDHTYVFRVINDPIYYALSGHIEAVERTLKKVPPKSLQLYQSFRRLQVIYQNASEKKPNTFQDIKQLEEEAQGVLNGLLRAVESALDPGLQLRILKMAQWVQAIFRVKKDMKETMGRLRVVNGLKYEHMNRWLTYGQFKALRNEERFLSMLLRSNMHYVADLIFEDSDSKKKIFLHWAKCKIEKETPITAIDQIKLRYNAMSTDLHTKYVFTELALELLTRSQPQYDLAIRLAQNQPHPSRKCIVFLLIFSKQRSLDLIDKLLQFTEGSFCNGAIHRTLETLRGLRDQVSSEVWLGLLPKKPFLENFYLRMLRAQNNQEEMQRYMEINKMYADLAYLSLARQLKSGPNHTLKQATDILQAQYSKILPTLTDQAARCQPRPWMTRLRELKNKTTEISEDDVEYATKDGELECLGQLVVNKDKNINLAVRIFRKIKTDKVYEILKVKGKLRDALEVAFERKSKTILEELIQEIPFADEETLAYGKQMLAELTLPR